MTSQELKEIRLPDGPGIYRFKQGATILYVGKATSLKDRVKSYFNKDIIETRGPRIIKMVELADSVEHQQTDSVLEALILEAQLIKKHQPFYNVREKDDKSWWHVVITQEAIPRVLQVRGKQLVDGTYDPDDFADTFGPFTSGLELKEALKIIRRIFPYHDKKIDKNGKPCFDAQVGLCPGVCAGWISAAAYKKQISKIRLFFKGKKKELIATMEREMRDCAKKQDFEHAALVKKKIFALQHIHDIALIKRKPVDSSSEQTTFRIEAYDIAHLGGHNTVGAMVVMEDGELKKSDYRKFKIYGPKANKADDTANLAEILERRLKHEEWPLPDLVVVDGSKAQINRVNSILLDRSLKIPVVGVVKDERHKANSFQGDPQIIHDYRREITHINAEVHRFAISYHRKLRARLVPPGRDEL
jgi:excinuclease ABC subunit C